MREKSDLRREALARRPALLRPHMGEALAAQVAVLEIPPGAVVAGFAAFRDEADPGLLMRALGAQGHPLALPRVVGKNRALVFHHWHQDDELVRHRFGMAEPHPGTEIAVPDVVLVPLLAFDSHGHRLGYGGGFYDRTLVALRKQKNVVAIGIAYAGQQIAVVPHDAHDQRLDSVLTENGLTRF